MNKLREILREHQEATDCDDSKMLDIVTGFLEKEFGGIYPTGCIDRLMEFVVESLERGPGDIS